MADYIIRRRDRGQAVLWTVRQGVWCVIQCWYIK